MLSPYKIDILPNESYVPPLIVGGCFRASSGKDAEDVSELSWKEK